jgi:hypothetical protein
MVDLWNDGNLDVIVANQGEQVSVMRNTSKKEHNWIAFSLEGTKSNKSAIGAIATLEWQDQLQSQVVYGGVGFASQNQRALHFGIGDATNVKRLTIVWPSGIRTELESPEINKTHKIVEGNENS